MGSTFAVCALLIITQRWHGGLSLDHDLSGAQKLHQAPVPRIGGLALAIGLCIGALVGYLLGGKTYPVVMQLLACAFPVFAAGFWEDLTKKVSVRTRLYASFVSAGIAAWVLEAHLGRLDTPVLDTLIALAPVSVMFTCFAVGGMTNAVNIIDGLNGLAAGCVTLMLAGLAAIAFQVGDVLVMKLCLWGMAALLGFLILNFPFGRIFLGDGGAYLAGFWLAECGILLLNRNPSVSTWAVLLCCLYPVWETIFSVYRRQILHRVSSGRPDMTHMHHLVYRHIASSHLRPFGPTWLKHGMSSGFIWVMVALCPLIAANAYNQTPVLIVACLGFIVAYHLIYKHILRARTEQAHRTEGVVQIERP
jgi:UDP-GlcNAc:undecaprenyl-phosphate GlcNAc-1-phosphate transferase